MFLLPRLLPQNLTLAPPSNEMCVMLVNEIKKILFPNFYECHFIIEERIDSIKQILKSQLKCAYTLAKINEDILNVTKKFIDEMPKLIEDLNTDLEAAYDGDPAAYDKIEIVYDKKVYLCNSCYDLFISKQFEDDLEKEKE